LTVISTNVIPGYTGLIKDTDTKNEGPFDFLSVMMAGQNYGSINNLPTMVPLPPYMQFVNIFGQGDPVLTPYDRAGMAAVYGPGPTLTNVVTNTQDSGPGSLRAALYYAYDHPGTAIQFNIPITDPGFSNGVFNIQPTGVLPSLLNATILDGTTEPTNSNPNGPCILLNGSLAQISNGLRLRGTNCVVRSLVINGCQSAGLLIDGSNSMGNVVSGCYLGLNPPGTVAMPNLVYGISIWGGAQSNLIGGYVAAARNVISGNGSGVFLANTNTTGNVVVGNYIGLNAAGSAAIPNKHDGLEIGNGAAANTVGGTGGGGNCISGNGGSGVVIFNFGSSNNVVQGNMIGLNPLGTVAMPNLVYGISIWGGAQSNLIGGYVAAARNVISGNRSGVFLADTNTTGNVVVGNYIGLNVAGSAAIPNKYDGLDIGNGASANTVGGTGGGGNCISGNGGSGVVIFNPGSSNNVVQGNMIGLNPLGTVSLPNAACGIAVWGGAQSNLIGGYTSAARNVISGNGSTGVGLGDSNTMGNVVVGNYIGLNAAGSAAIPNIGSGVAISSGAAANTIGGSGAAGNCISGNSDRGVIIYGLGSIGNVVQGNVIGLNPSGSVALSNGSFGIHIFGGAQSNLIGGFNSINRNIISGNNSDGVFLAQDNTAGNIVAGNYIGLNAAGTAAIPNNGCGVLINFGAAVNTIGGIGSGGNCIAGNSDSGIAIDKAGTTGNLVEGNIIGLNPNGSTVISNAFAGVEIDSSSSNVIGGNTAGAGNVISGNGNSGILIRFAGSSGNIVQGNIIGLNAAGSASVPNGYCGVEIGAGASVNTIGGAAGGRNIVSGNIGYGIGIHDSGTSANMVQGNTIGFDTTSSISIPNNAGIALWGGAVSNQIGGLAPGSANLVAGNLYGGVWLVDAGTTNNSVRGNSIFDNTGQGLMLYHSANGSAISPTLFSAVLSINTTISGLVLGLPNSVYHMDFYANPPPSGDTEGMTYLGSQDFATGPGGTASFTANLGARIPAGNVITATTTDLSGNTSALSGSATVTTVSSVNDGIPNAWRALYFGGNGSTTNSQSCATCDPDHDGMNNLQKFLAGTNPTNSACSLKLGIVSANPTNKIVYFASAAGTVYRMESCDDLSLGAWALFADQIVGTGADLFLIDPGVPMTGRRFYRLQVLW
jgi:titin